MLSSLSSRDESIWLPRFHPSWRKKASTRYG